MKKTIFILFILCLFSFDVSAQSNKNKRSSTLRGALRTERTCFDVFYYNLFLKINPDKKYISGHNKIHFTTTDTTSKIQIDLYENLTLSKIIFRSQPVKFVREYDAVWVYFPSQLIKNGSFFIDVYYEGTPKNSTKNTQRHGFHWDKMQNGKHLVGVSCEYDGASLWYPNKDHLTDEPDSMRVHWTVPDDLQCISNGVLESITKSPKEVGYLTHNWFIKNPINNYNVTIYLGDYKELIDEYTNPITKEKHNLYYYYYNGTQNEAIDYFGVTKQFLAFFEEIYGEYPFWNDKFAVVQSNYAGMEHQGCLAIGETLNVYDNWYYGIGVNYHSTLIHEIAHEWWGNSVSVGDMADVWMHEGFATYSEALFIERISGKKAYDSTIQTMSHKIQSFLPLVGGKEININMFGDSHIYMGGAYFLDNLRTKINDDKIFFDILKSFQLKFRKKIITTTDFLNMVNEKTKQDFTKFFRDKLYK